MGSQKVVGPIFLEGIILGVNYTSCSYKMHQYLLGHGYWSYVEGANDATPDLTRRDFLDIWDAKTPKDASVNLKRIFAAIKITRKLQVRKELSNV